MAPTLATADLIPSDDEDEDFVAGSDDSDSDDSEAERPSKKAKVDAAPVEPVCVSVRRCSSTSELMRRCGSQAHEGGRGRSLGELQRAGGTSQIGRASCRERVS